MYARHVALRLKANMPPGEFARTFDQEILPVLRRQEGFEEVITLVTQRGTEAIAISLWDTKAHADLYSRQGYPEVWKILSKVTEGTPQVQAYEVVTSTFKKESQVASR
jgi:heme-degrading monooxygenase HmoA